MPDELDFDDEPPPDEELEPEDPELDVVVAGELELEECDEDELLPQPAAISASTVSAITAGRREMVNVVMYP